MLETSGLSAKLVYGSDFPVSPMPLSCIGRVQLRRALQLRRVRNTFDQAVQMMQAAGVPQEVFARAEQLLRIPANKKQELAAGLGRVAA